MHAPMDAALAPPRPDLRRIGAWYVGLLVLGNFVHPGWSLVSIPFDFLLKDRFHLGPQALARAHAWIGLTAYLAFFFGYLRDRWSPFGMGDRGLALIALPFMALAYLLLALGGTDPARAVVLLLLCKLAYGFVAAAWDGAKVAFGQAHGVTDRISALRSGVGCVGGAAASFLGGWVAEAGSFRALCVVLAGLTLTLLAFVARPPRGAFVPRRVEPRKVSNPARSIAALVRHRPSLVVLGFAFLWSFAPSYGAPLTYHLTDGIGMSERQYGLYNAVQTFAPIPLALLYAPLSRRLPLRGILATGIALGVVQPLLFFLIHAPNEAIALAVLMGLTDAVYGIAAYDLTLRVLPPELAGTGFALTVTLSMVAGTLSELLGSAIFERSGFAATVWTNLPFTALMIPLLLLLPRRPGETAQ